jgi:hypothetical protein
VVDENFSTRLDRVAIDFFPDPDIVRIASIYLINGRELTLGVDDSGTLHTGIDGQLAD